MIDENSDILAIIPARAGSKGLKGKNLRLLGGKPLIAWTIEAVIKCKTGLDVCFTTEDKKISDVAKSYGAPVYFLRNKRLAEDDTSSLMVLLDALSRMEEMRKRRYRYVMYLQPTSPFRHKDLVDKAVEFLKSSEGEVLSVVGVTPVKDSHPYWDMKMREDGVMEYYMDLDFPRPMRRQDLPSAYHLNGAISVTKRRYFDEAEDPMPAFGFPFKGLVMNEVESVNIDTEFDFSFAEFLLNCDLL